DELDVLEDERPPPPPKPGLGRPAKPKKRSQRVQTLGAAVKGASEAPPPPRSVAPPPPKARSNPSVPPPAPRPKSVAPPPPARKDPSTPAARRDPSAPSGAPSEAFIFSLTQEPPKSTAPLAVDATTPDP